MEAIVLAGGLGRRLHKVVPDMPKPLAPINGRPFLEYLLKYWIGQGVDHFVLSTGYKHKKLESHFGNRYDGAKLTYSVETTPLGTGGGLLKAVGHLKQHAPYLALNGDTLFEIPLEKLIKHHQSKRANISLALFEMGGNHRYGNVMIDRDNRISSLNVKTKAAKNRQYVNGGVYLLEEHFLSATDCSAEKAISLEHELFPNLLKNGRRFFGFPFNERFIDIGIPTDYEKAGKMLHM